MVIKITQAKASRGMVAYNDKKLKAGEASILGYNKIATDGQAIEQISGKILAERLEGRSALNGGKGKKFIHISINPNPDEKLTDEKLKTIAKDYMKQIGYASQPYLIYKHTDIDREHIHVVACSIKENGTLISDSNLFYKSNKIRKELEEKYNLVKGNSRNIPAGNTLEGMDYKKSFSTGQIKTISLTTLDQLKFSNYKQYEIYLKGLDVSVRQAKTKEGKVLGLTYQPLEGGQLQGVPVKASRLEPGGRLGMDALERGFKKNSPLIESGKEAFEQRLETAIANGAGLRKEGIKPIFDGEEVFGFADLKTGYFHSLESIRPELRVSAGDVKPETEVSTDETKPELTTGVDIEERSEKSSSNTSADAPVLGENRGGNEESAGAGDLLESIGSALGQMGGDSSSPDNDKELKKKKKRKRGI